VRVIALLCAVLCSGVWAARASSAGPSAGQVYSFGGNLQGELGKAMPMNDPTARAVPLPAAAGPATAIAAGAEHSLIIGSDRKLYVFGSNTYGQLGRGVNLNATTPNPTPTAVTLPGATGPVVRAAGGEDFSLAMTSTGQLFSFGANAFGELGTGINDAGASVPRPTPAPVRLPATVKQIGAGEFAGFAITSDDRLYSWGENNFGQLGTTGHYGTLTASPSPAQVMLTHTGRLTAVAAGGEHTVVLTSTGEVFTFGHNQYGQLGRPVAGATSSPAPGLVSFPGVSGSIVAIAAGQNHTLALSSAGQLYAFGDNYSGRLGNSVNDRAHAANPTPTLVKMPGGSGAIAQIAAGADYSLALTSSGRLYAFGGNNYGQLGSTTNNGTDNPNPTPSAVPVPGGAGLAAAVSGADSEHTLGLVAPRTATLRVNSIAPAGPRAGLAVTCSGAAGSRCAGAIIGTSIEHLVSGKLVSVTAAKTDNQTARTVKLVKHAYTLAAGHKAHITISLNSAGRALLDHFYSVPVRLAITSAGKRSTRKATFRYGLIRAPIDYFWYSRPGYSFIGNLSASSLRRSWHATLTCRGGGCPLKRTALKIHGGRTSATAALKGAHLRPGAVVQLTISGANEVAEVLRFVMASGALPRTTALCQTPTQRAPGACHR
jgi:alpha-tubulin suppressor-like RCC1 family protein